MNSFAAFAVVMAVVLMGCYLTAWICAVNDAFREVREKERMR